MKKAVIYIHGSGGHAGEAEHYKPLFPGCDVRGFDYKAQTPWEAAREFTEYFEYVSRSYEEIIVIANSIGAFFVMNARLNEKIKKAYFISPVADMETLILNRMKQENVTEDRLREKKELRMPEGDVLSWEYLCYVRQNPVRWTIPTRILYGEKDALTSFDTVTRFAGSIGASLCVMQDGEHWFHTDEQMRFLDNWIKTEEKS